MSAAADPLSTGQPPLLRLRDFSVFAESPLCLGAGESLLLANRQAVFSDVVLGKGWSGLESEFAWTDGKSAELAICLRSTVRALSFDLAAFLPTRDSRQSVSVFVSGRRVGDFAFDASSPHGQRTIELPDRSRDQTLPITFVIAHPTSPKEVGQSDDSRKLGVAIYGIESK